LFGILIKQLSRMEQTCTLFVNHPNNGIPKNVKNSNNILVCLGTVRHESFEVWFRVHVFEHCVVELCLHDLLLLNVFKLHFTNCNGYNFAISQIINMASRCCPTSDMFNMAKHDPKVL
jgi:hypothetical protein